MKQLLIRLASAVPPPLKRWLYRHPRLLKPLARRLKNAMPAEGFTIVTIAAGPNKGLKLAVNQSTPNYYWVNDAYEPHVLSAMRSTLKSGMTALDIGAHIGFDTMLMARLLGPAGKVIAFEPDPGNFQWLTRNCQLNALANVTLNHQAVSDRAGSLAFAADGLTTSHLLAEDAADSSAIRVPTITLDDWFDQTGLKPGFIKIDVENHEPAVVRGATRLLQEHHPLLLIEIHSPQSLADCVGQLKTLGYALRPLPENDCYRAAINGTEAGESTFTIAHLLADTSPP